MTHNRRIARSTNQTNNAQPQPCESSKCARPGAPRAQGHAGEEEGRGERTEDMFGPYLFRAQGHAGEEEESGDETDRCLGHAFWGRKDMWVRRVRGVGAVQGVGVRWASTQCAAGSREVPLIRGLVSGALCNGCDLEADAWMFLRLGKPV
eukprot:365700-Chlamydomonas_euryale.AAC.3